MNCHPSITEGSSPQVFIKSSWDGAAGRRAGRLSCHSGAQHLALWISHMLSSGPVTFLGVSWPSVASLPRRGLHFSSPSRLTWDLVSIAPLPIFWTLGAISNVLRLWESKIRQLKALTNKFFFSSTTNLIQSVNVNGENKREKWQEEYRSRYPQNYRDTYRVCRTDQRGNAGVRLYDILQGDNARKSHSLDSFEMLYHLKFPAWKCKEYFVSRKRLLYQIIICHHCCNMGPSPKMSESFYHTAKHERKWDYWMGLCGSSLALRVCVWMDRAVSRDGQHEDSGSWFEGERVSQEEGYIRGTGWCFRGWLLPTQFDSLHCSLTNLNPAEKVILECLNGFSLAKLFPSHPVFIGKTVLKYCF